MRSTRSPLIGLLALIFTTKIALAADPTALRYYEDALQRFNAGDYKGAQIQLKNSLQRDPGQLSAKILMGRTLLELNQVRTAEEELLSAQKLGADPLVLALPLAQARNRLRRFDENIKAIVPTQHPVSQQPALWVELGKARMRSGDPAGARAAFESALRIDGNFHAAQVGLARLPLIEKRFAEASELADRILAGAPRNADAWDIKGTAAYARGRFDEAVHAYGMAFELEPDNYQAALGEASAMLESGEAAKAVILFGELRERFPLVPTVPYLQSKALAALGRADEAKAAQIAAADIIAKFAPGEIADNPNDLRLFGTIAYDSGQLETAFKYLSLLQETEGADFEGTRMLGKTLLAMGKPGEARRVLSRIASGPGTTAEILALLGDAYVQLGDQAAAEHVYLTALHERNGGPAIMRRLAMLQHRSGRNDRALQTLKDLVDHSTGTVATDSALLLGLLYYGEDRFNEAGAIANRLAEADPSNYTARNLQGVVAIALGDAVKGREILNTILAEQPAFRPARFNLVKLDVAEGRTEAAMKALGEILAKDPNDVRALLESARLAESLGQYRVAIGHLEKIHEIEPDDILAHVELINAYLAVNDHAQALTRAVELDQLAPNEFVVKDALARVRIAGGEPGDARGTLIDVARLAGDDPKRLLYTARLQTQVGSHNDAAYSLLKILAIQPDHQLARNELAAALFRQGKLDEAEEQTQRALKSRPKDPVALAMLADIRLAQGQTEDAIALYRRGQAIADTPQLAISLHRALVRAGRAEEARETLQAWHEAHPDVPAVMRLLARDLNASGQKARALVLLERLVELVPQDAGAWNGMAILLSATDTERALKAAMTAYELAPENPAILDNLGWSLVQLGELDTGLARLREAAARNGASATIRYHLGVALQEYGNANAARYELEQALQLSKDFPERDKAIARLGTLINR